MAAFDGVPNDGSKPDGVHVVVRGILDGVAYQTWQQGAWSSGWSVAQTASTEFAPEVQEGIQCAFYVTAKDRGLYYLLLNPTPKNGSWDERVLVPVDTWRPVAWSIFVKPMPPKPDFIDVGWRWCTKCKGLWYAGFGGASTCPAGGAHSINGSGNYSVSLNAPAIPEPGHWRWCSKCQGLFFVGPVPQAFSPTACKPIANDIQALEADKDDLQAQLQQASSGEKPALVAAINNLTNQINAKKAQLATCVNEHRLCPAGGNHSGTSSGEYRVPQLPKNVRLHVKILFEPITGSIEDMLENCRQVFNSVGIGIELVSTESLDLPDLMDLDIGECPGGGGLTADQQQLFEYRNNVAGNDVVVYFVRSLIQPASGCARHPAGKPGAAIASLPSMWTLTHELGHVLGLVHCDTDDALKLQRLMTSAGTALITNLPPDLVASEVSMLKSSTLTAYV
jgi:hypothetical protein